MIISASRRTDIPAFYTEWFLNRIRAGYCTVPNPFNRNQVTYVSLRPEDVDVIVFWTRYPRPLLPHLAELNERGYRYYFQYTIMNNPRWLDPKSPSVDTAIAAMRELANAIGPERVIWRYDPIVLSTTTDAGFHARTYAYIASLLRGYTRRSVISIVDQYKKAERRLQQVTQQGITLHSGPPDEWSGFADLMRDLVQIATANGMEIQSCSEDIDLQQYGIVPGRCVDDAYISRTFGIEVTGRKDPSQRKECGCVISRDIGMYDSCLFGCQYCYATSSFQRAKVNHDQHDPHSPSLLGHYGADPMPRPEEQSPAHSNKREGSCTTPQLPLPLDT